jgi:UDP-N-acetylmuramoylalanine--D-glutamate ligase
MKGKRIVILGGGISGVGAAILAKKQGFDVFVSEKAHISDADKNRLINADILFEEEQHSKNLILNASEIIKSPGIPDKADIVKEAITNKIPVISEIEFASRYTDAKLICITGSNGKTTTTQLIYHIFKQAGYNVGIAGNVGQSFALQVADNKFDYYVLELSSFQLDNMYEFKADVAVLLNITPDHLDRYNYNFQNYINSKFRIIQNLTSTDSFIFCADDEQIQNELSKKTINAQMFPFSVKNEIPNGAYKHKNQIHFNINSKQFIMENSLLSIEGDHNIYNSMAAGLAAMINNIKNEEIKKSLSGFTGVEHRLEKYIKVRGIQFINDSKATNVNSVWYALQTINDPIVLIMGGTDKGNDYGVLKDLVKRKVKAIVALGLDNQAIFDAFEDFVNVYDTKSMHEAVKTAYQIAYEGDAVLLSPACASFDLFENYEDRGTQFKNEVRNL